MMRRPSKLEPIDEYLSSHGLYRKITAKDGSCLFRAVSEQVFYTQAQHMEVRLACINFMTKKKEHFEPFIDCPFNEYISRLTNPWEWGGDVEISALSLLYERDFLIYEEIGKAPVEATENGFSKKIVLCFTHGNHYDSVFTKQFQDTAAICQAVVYELLYKDVFKLHDKVDEAIDILRYPNRIPFPCEQENEESSRQQEHELESSGEVFDRGFDMKRENKRRPPFPYKVIKSLDPEIYRNVEFDTWSDFKKQQQHREYLISAGMHYALGDKCLVHLEDASKFYNAHIQEVSSANGPVTVFIEEMGEKCTVPIKNLRPLNQPPQSYKCISPRSFKNQGGHISPHLRILKRGRFLSDSVYVLGDDQSAYPDQAIRDEKYSPYKQGSHRYLSPYRMRRGVHYSRQRTYSQGSDTDEHVIVESSMYDLPDEDVQGPFSQMPVHVHQGGPVEGKSGGCWGKLRRRGRTSPSLNHPRNLVHDHYSDQFVQGCDMQVDDEMYEEQVIDDSQRPQPHRRKTPSPAQDMSQGNIQEGHFVCTDPSWSDSNSSIIEDKMPKPLNNNATQPNMMPVNSQPSMSIGIPFCPIMLPATDNLTGPVNIAAGSSRDQNGSDLPLHDVSTLRFFYNLGFEYYHQVCIYQAQQQRPPTKLQGPEIIQYPVHYQTFPPPIPPPHQMQMQTQPMRPAVVQRMPYQEGTRCRSSSLGSIMSEEEFEGRRSYARANGMVASEAYYQDPGFAKPPPAVTTYLPVAQPMPPFPGTPQMQMAALNLDTPPVTPTAYQYPLVGPRQTAPPQQIIYRSPTKPNPQIRGKNVNGFIVV